MPCLFILRISINFIFTFNTAQGVDLQAARRFEKQFYLKYANTKINFCCDTFQHCLLKVVKERKPLLFIIHNENVELSHIYCKLLSMFEKVICAHFLILGWAIWNNDSYCERLSNKILIVNEVLENLENKTPGIFAIIPNDGSVKVLHSMNNSRDFMYRVNSEDCLAVQFFFEFFFGCDYVKFRNCRIEFHKLLQKTMKFMSMYITQDFFYSLTSAKYQQWMYEELGNRDYDSFEPTEGELLKEKILFALYGPPRQLKDRIGYEVKEKEHAEQLYQKIREKNNDYSKWNDRIVIAFIFVCVEMLDKPESHFIPIPVFVIRRCKIKAENNRENEHRCRIFIDDTGRVYDTWENYLEDNKLPPCKMIYPKNGRYHGDRDGNVLFGKKDSPSCGMVSKAGKLADTTANIGEFVSGGLLLAAYVYPPLGVVTVPAKVASFTFRAYSTGRSIYVIADRRTHEQSISSANAESRAAYLNIGADTFSIVGDGVTKGVSFAVKRDANVGKKVQHTSTAINAGNVAIAGASTVNNFHDVYQQCLEQDNTVPSPLELAQLGSSLFFFGNSVFEFRIGKTMVRKVQTDTIKKINATLQNDVQRLYLDIDKFVFERESFSVYHTLALTELFRETTGTQVVATQYVYRRNKFFKQRRK